MITCILVITTGFTLAYSQNESIPQWIKNTAGWWSSGDIDDSDYVKSLQYLVSQGIIEIPIKKVHAINTQITNSDVAKSFTYRIIDDKGIEYEFYSFVRFNHLYENIKTRSVSTSYTSDSVGFLLASVPSLDKKILYDFFNKSLKHHETIRYEMFIDVLTGNGQIIQTWDYNDCTFLEYNVDTYSNKNYYQFNSKDEVEIQEQFLFICSSFSLIT